MTPRDKFIDRLSDRILALINEADACDYSDLTASAIALAAAAWDEMHGNAPRH